MKTSRYPLSYLQYGNVTIIDSPNDPNPTPWGEARRRAWGSGCRGLGGGGNPFWVDFDIGYGISIHTHIYIYIYISADLSRASGV